jgi:hypothetical protein
VVKPRPPGAAARAYRRFRSARVLTCPG